MFKRIIKKCNYELKNNIQDKNINKTYEIKAVIKYFKSTKVNARKLKSYSENKNRNYLNKLKEISC